MKYQTCSSSAQGLIPVPCAVRLFFLSQTNLDLLVYGVVCKLACTGRCTLSSLCSQSCVLGQQAVAAPHRWSSRRRAACTQPRAAGRHRQSRRHQERDRSAGGPLLQHEAQPGGHRRVQEEGTRGSLGVVS